MYSGKNIQYQTTFKYQLKIYTVGHRTCLVQCAIEMYLIRHRQLVRIVVRRSFIK